uniref:Ig-like domain-containing protein n=1 Tax=Oncorhynchus tshawytscha TaxID=74940 RepID=A0A8C8GBH4_ONCTS
MCRNVFVFDPFCLFALTVCAFTKLNVIQPTPVMVAELGGTVTLTCLSSDESVTRFNWFKQSFGQEPLLMASSLYVGQDRDSATYYCSTAAIYELTYGDRTVLFVKVMNTCYSLSSDSESNIMSVLQQPVSESVQPGDSVTLNCTIHTETCAGEHSVLWFRHGSGESRPGIIYTHGNWSDQCEKSTETEKSCIYNLPKRNLSLSDAGTYYCAVASCGEILFGNGTKLDIDGSLLCRTYIYLSILIFFVIIFRTRLSDQKSFSYQIRCRGKQKYFYIV